MRGLLGRRRAAPGPDAPAALAPEQPFVAIGDVHGRDDLCDALLGRLAREHPDLPVVFVGDYIDRGEQSCAVLRRLMGRPELVCLLGNHEDMCLQFLDAPEKIGPVWMRNGGVDTLASFGVALQAGAGAGAFTAARDRLEAAMGAALVDWLRNRPLLWRSGNVWVSHAGADPARPMAEQPRDTLLWWRPDGRARDDGQRVVHGHTIVPEPEIAQGRIAIDTGAYATGRLTAAVVAPGRCDFLSA